MGTWELWEHFVEDRLEVEEGQRKEDKVTKSVLQRKQDISIIKISWLVLFPKGIAVWCESHVISINTLREKCSIAAC